MGLDSKHPLYEKVAPDWIIMRDTYAGERTVKEKNFDYLPPTAGMVIDDCLSRRADAIGWIAYRAYVMRAVYYNFVADAVERMIGHMHRQPANIKLPKAMEPLLEDATSQGESLQLLLRKINTEQLVSGRIGIMADLPAHAVSGDIIPYLTTYVAEAIINWDDGTYVEHEDDESKTVDTHKAALNLVVLDESGYQRTPDFTWTEVKRYRVLVLGDVNKQETPGAEGVSYKTALFANTGTGDNNLIFDESKLVTPVLTGQPLDEIPFVFINSKDIVTTPDDPPLIGLANLSVAIYRAEADYRQSLHKQGQDTLVIIGGNPGGGLDGEPGSEPGGAWRVGSGASIEVDVGGDAKFIGVDSSGLSEQREALSADKKAAEGQAGNLIDTQNRSAESGNALEIRVSARTTTLTQIAQAGAAGLQKILRTVARWKGLNEDEVQVEPNLDFVDAPLTGQELVQLMTARSQGAPIALQTIHEMLFDRGLTKLSWEDELKRIEKEQQDGLDILSGGVGTGTGVPSNIPGTGNPGGGDE